MTPNLVKEGGVVAERRKPILGLGGVISDLKLDIEGLKMTNSLKLLEMQLCDLTERARGLKDCPYKSGAFPQLMEFVARAFEPLTIRQIMAQKLLTIWHILLLDQQIRLI